MESPKTGYSIERYILSISRYYIGAAFIMTLLIGATYKTVKIALDRHALQQEISFLASHEFIRFQQLANQTRAVMRASVDPDLPEYIITPMLDGVRDDIDEIRNTMARLQAMHDSLRRNWLERISAHDPAEANLYDDLNRRLDDFLARAERVVNVSAEDRRRRYSFWGPIDFAVSADSILMRQFSELIDHVHDRSEHSIGNAVLITTALLIALAAILVLASVFLFRPLLRNLRDEHSRKMAFENKLSHIAHTDPLTALENRSSFNTALNDLLRRYNRLEEGFAMLLVDLDHFKPINDSFGHPAGDAALLRVANALRDIFRADDVIARIGGDEFAVLLPGITDDATLQEIADRAVAKLAISFLYEGNSLQISASIGGAIVPTHAKDEEGLVRVADLALYTAKIGRNRAIIFDEESFAERMKNNELAAALACAADRDEFIVHYQPKVNLLTGAHVGFEALVRWNHPTLGVLPPGRFLPLMENPQLIHDMTRAVVNSVGRDLKAWKEAGLAPGAVSINLPEGLLVTTKGFDLFDAVVREYGLDWHDLAVEVTEDVFLNRNAELIHSTVGNFRERGVSISLDDFGTGFASLVHLRDFPFDELKIDRGFVDGIGVDDRSEQIVRTMIDLARNIGKRCVAEGVETTEQHQFLSRHGCEIGQGFLFARPMPLDNASEYLGAPATEGHEMNTEPEGTK